MRRKWGLLVIVVVALAGTLTIVATRQYRDPPKTSPSVDPSRGAVMRGVIALPEVMNPAGRDLRPYIVYCDMNNQPSGPSADIVEGDLVLPPYMPCP